MKKMFVTLIISFVIIISGCSISQSTTNTTEITTTTTEITTTEDVVVSSIINVIDYASERNVKVVGVITAIDDRNNFFIQDSTAGIYISGSSSFGLILDNTFIGREVKITGVKNVVDGIQQIEIQSLSDINILNQNAIIPNPLVVNDFTSLNLYVGRLITLVNVEIGEKVNHITEIKNQDDLVLAKVIDGVNIQNRDFVDVTGVFYHSISKGNLMIINDNASVTESSYMTNLDRLNQAFEKFVVPNNVMDDYYLPTRFKDVAITWSTESVNIVIDDNQIKRLDNLTTDLEILLIATLSIGDEQSISKTINVTLVKEAYWSLALTENFIYQGPTFPTHELNIDFWNRGGGIQKVDFISCGDGDTARFRVNLANGSTSIESVRFFAVDTEETHHPDYGAEEWGYPGSDYTCSVLTNGSEFYLESDTVDGPRDTYNRLLSWIWVDGELLQYNLVALGLAETRYTYFTGDAGTYDDLLEALELVAIENRVGKWSGFYDPYWNYETNQLKG